MNDLIPGAEVEARGLRWQVIGVDRQGGQVVCRLRGLGGVALGESIEILADLEPVHAIRHEIAPDRAARFQDWLLYHQGFALEQALGPHALLAVQPGRLEIQPYQLVPVIRALAMSRVRMMLADGVGLGKTVQAGLVVTELMARRLVQRVLIVSPAGPLLEQWRGEMRDRFGLKLRVVDRGTVEEVRRQIEMGANPFDHIPIALASVDYLKQERVLSELERSSYDIVIIDEAHHCVDPGTAGLRDDSLRRRLAEVLASRCDALLLLTATPHDGNDRSFASLCELLDPSLVDGRGVIRGDRYRRHVVRRLKKHIRDPRTGGEMFPERIVEPARIVVDPTANPAFAELSKRLLALIAPELRRALREKRYSELLSFFALLKRSVSTVEACQKTLQVVLDRLSESLKHAEEDKASRTERIRTLRDARRRLERFGVGTAEEEEELQGLELNDVAEQLADLERYTRRQGRRDSHAQSFIESLRELIILAEKAKPHDPKLARLLDEIQSIRKTNPKANVLVYSEYTTSQEVAAAALKASGFDVLTLSGADPEPRRLEVTQRFREMDGLVMICTDAAAEGLNLHQRCHHLIHLELPFNPNRLEQRNGRIDRYGQKFQPVVRYLYLASTFEENILLRLIAKYERQRKMLTFVPNTLGVTASAEDTRARLLEGVIDAENMLFRGQAPKFTLTNGDPADGADGSLRELLEEIDKSFKNFEKAAKSNSWLADAGLQADEATAKAAELARDEGSRAAQVDLARFVVNAILRDGGDCKGKLTDPVFTLKLPATWAVDLEDSPGADPEQRLVRLTTSMDVVVDAQKNLVGYLGRAHPLVRHAIDRVRNTSLGDSGPGKVDHRASAVTGPVKTPTLCYTYLARVNSADGRELERLVSVNIAQGAAPQFSDDPTPWLGGEQYKAIVTTGVWEKHFAPWAKNAGLQAGVTAVQGFKTSGERFIDETRQSIEQERKELDRWLDERAKEILPAAGPTQADLFAPSPAAPAPPKPTTPAERLAALASQRSNRLAADADSVLKIYEGRVKRLDARDRLGAPEIVPLGLLMIIPEGSHGA